jgi:hypothetical protein
VPVAQLSRKVAALFREAFVTGRLKLGHPWAPSN